MLHACVQRFDVMDEKFFGGELRPCLVHSKNQKVFKIFRYRIFRHMYETLNIDKKKLIVQFTCKSRDKSFDLS